MVLTVTPVYAAILAGLFLILSARVIRYRRGNLISLGDAGDKALLKRMRAQANCAEYVPLALLLLLLCELVGAPSLALHLLGLALLTGRAMHAFGMSATPQRMSLRVGGMALTLLMIAISAIGLLAHAVI